ncbi:antitoxin VapB family protein [Thermococcus sp. GR6]|uniref:antitoxin VapB family protein n=1 Tax=Thermococcus sp. GR6 TaxID=1638256 RepID=UPI00143073AE|nr:antitoxin VapB family protein [Thermococcus sp. GR6]NJE42943.1 hypothetical protein [Thermococcus sp. GR6]
MAGKEHTSKREKRGNLDVLMIAFGTMSEEEVERFRKTLKEVEEWMNEWTPCRD